MWKWILALLLFPVIAYSYGNKNDWAVTPTDTDEGDSPLFFNVACDPSVWTTVVSSDTIRRVAFIQTDYTIAPPICLSTAASLSKVILCDTSIQGLILGTATVTSVTLHTKNAWSCRTNGATTVQTGFLHGYSGRDQRDYGAIGSKALQ